jgi:GNAT superfamily N-acetyltransferase
LFVKPEKRGTRAATLLTRQLIEWAEIIGAQEIVGGNDNEFNSERTARFLEHFGFRRVGIAMRRVI